MKNYKTTPNVNKAPKVLAKTCADCGFSTKDNRKMRQHGERTDHKVR